MTWLKENCFKLTLLFFTLILLGLVFYWYEWRPTQIIMSCAEDSSQDFRLCLFKKGYPLDVISTNQQ